MCSSLCGIARRGVFQRRLEAEFAALARFRTAALNMSRLGVANGVAVVGRSAANDRANLLRLLGWLVAEGLLAKPMRKAPPT